ncbi:hypothetical protein E2C01_015084 [Portunus trituberculatus]|uniref:Uncharacterized protein n=1 Tax=Portunus trituberculatus TaxID=210409 RepID=A0A5B7DLS0_PORTR|nr:hypothetical protein [Portunus trituberculatus]
MSSHRLECLISLKRRRARQYVRRTSQYKFDMALHARKLSQFEIGRSASQSAYPRRSPYPKCHKSLVFVYLRHSPTSGRSDPRRHSPNPLTIARQLTSCCFH